MAYAYLQLGQDREARRAIEEVAAITKFSGARGTTDATRDRRLPAARYVLERAGVV